MSFPHQPQPVKYFLGLIYNGQVSLWDLERVLQNRFDFIDRKSPALEFDGFTDYYQKEMGQTSTAPGGACTDCKARIGWPSSSFWPTSWRTNTAGKSNPKAGL
ncbi:DUF4416 family protein [candidate division TA06 bacterium]|uniref:DUF4416 family protein n=1 Tax=candidate division TA06 bacterium TaxID=2250710 RepID=A0A933ID04_UNCT6|nr:DUF4416 family protein [candidate division TA06 bacterium]